MILSAECLPANVTRVGTFICMSAFMYEEVVGFGEVTVAVFADELFLWTGAESSGGFDVGMQAVRSSWIRVLPLKVVLVEGSVPDPVGH